MRAHRFIGYLRCANKNDPHIVGEIRIDDNGELAPYLYFEPDFSDPQNPTTKYVTWDRREGKPSGLMYQQSHEKLITLNFNCPSCGKPVVYQKDTRRKKNHYQKRRQ